MSYHAGIKLPVAQSLVSLVSLVSPVSLVSLMPLCHVMMSRSEELEKEPRRGRLVSECQRFIAPLLLYYSSILLRTSLGQV